MSSAVCQLCTLTMLVLIGIDAQVSNEEIYNQRILLNLNLGHGDGVQNNTASATSLIIRTDTEQQENSNDGGVIANNRRTRPNREKEDGNSKVNSPVINSFNGAGLLDSNYNEHIFMEESRGGLDLRSFGDEEARNIMSDGIPTISATPTSSDTIPMFLTAGQRNQDPIFDPSTPKNVTALVGKSAYLNCRVRNLANKTVSWIRHRDIHILTVGSYTYTSDQRFQATHDKENGDWTLQIKWVQKRDKGAYECQVSTQPVMSYFVNLEVVVPTAYIIGGPDLHVDKGSTINLTCSVRYSLEPPAYIFWFHQDEVISYDSIRGGVSVITEKGEVTISYLLIQNADLADSGKYSCSPSNADVASVRVHVLNGEHPEAMQTASASHSVSWLSVVLPLVIMIWQYLSHHHHHQHSHKGAIIDALTMPTEAAKIGTLSTISLTTTTTTSSTPPLEVCR